MQINATKIYIFNAYLNKCDATHKQIKKKLQKSKKSKHQIPKIKMRRNYNNLLC